MFTKKFNEKSMKNELQKKKNGRSIKKGKMNQQIHGLPNGEWGWGSKGGEIISLSNVAIFLFASK